MVTRSLEEEGIREAKGRTEAVRAEDGQRLWQVCKCGNVSPGGRLVSSR